MGRSAMAGDQEVTMAVVTVDGEPLWQVCGHGVCVRDRAGLRALEQFRLLCLAKGLPLPAIS